MSQGTACRSIVSTMSWRQIRERGQRTGSSCRELVPRRDHVLTQEGRNWLRSRIGLESATGNMDRPAWRHSRRHCLETSCRPLGPSLKGFVHFQRSDAAFSDGQVRFRRIQVIILIQVEDDQPQRRVYPSPARSTSSAVALTTPTDTSPSALESCCRETLPERRT